MRVLSTLGWRIFVGRVIATDPSSASWPAPVGLAARLNSVFEMASVAALTSSAWPTWLGLRTMTCLAVGSKSMAASCAGLSNGFARLCTYALILASSTCTATSSAPSFPGIAESLSHDRSMARSTAERWVLSTPSAASVMERSSSAFALATAASTEVTAGRRCSTISGTTPPLPLPNRSSSARRAASRSTTRPVAPGVPVTIASEKFSEPSRGG